MNSSQQAAPAQVPAEDRREDTLARIEAALRSAASKLQLDDGPGGIDPYDTHSGPFRRDVWGARPR